MSESIPSPISSQEQRSRLLRVRHVAKKLGFKGLVEYRHVVSNTGGAQYGIGSTADQDLLVVFADAFDRDADPNDFSLEAILAHERGHQLVVRHPKLAGWFARGTAVASEEIVASLIGSILAEREQDQRALYHKAIYEAITQGMSDTHAGRRLHDLRLLLEKLL